MHSVFQVQQIRGISHPQHGRGGRNHGHVRYDDSKRVQKHDSGQRNRDLSRAMDRRTLQHRILHDRGICTLTIRDPSIRTLTVKKLSHTWHPGLGARGVWRPHHSPLGAPLHV